MNIDLFKVNNGFIKFGHKFERGDSYFVIDGGEIISELRCDSGVDVLMEGKDYFPNVASVMDFIELSGNKNPKVFLLSKNKKIIEVTKHDIKVADGSIFIQL